METAQAGDKCDFTGTLIVVPDVGSISVPGARAESSSRKPGEGPESEGVRGLKALGVRDLNYRLAFLACSVVQSNPMVRSSTTLKYSLQRTDIIERFRYILKDFIATTFIVSVWWERLASRRNDSSRHQESDVGTRLESHLQYDPRRKLVRQPDKKSFCHHLRQRRNQTRYSAYALWRRSEENR